MVVLKQTGKGHRRKYEPIADRVSGGRTAESPRARLHDSDNMKNQKLPHQSTHLLLFFLLTASIMSCAVVMFTTSSEADRRNK